MITTLILTFTVCVVARISAQVAYRRYASRQAPSVQAWLAQTRPSAHF